MPSKLAVLATAAVATLAGLLTVRFSRFTPASAYAAVLETAQGPGPGGTVFTATAVGHEFRQDDSPTIAAAPDGSLWVAWLSFEGSRDDVAIRRYRNGKWSNLQWLPATSGDNWLPQIGTDASGKVWVVWTQQVGGNWDLYARSFDPDKQEWGQLQRLSSDPQPDINPRIASDGKGRLA